MLQLLTFVSFHWTLYVKYVVNVKGCRLLMASNTIQPITIKYWNSGNTLNQKCEISLYEIVFSKQGRRGKRSWVWLTTHPRTTHVSWTDFTRHFNSPFYRQTFTYEAYKHFPTGKLLYMKTCMGVYMPPNYMGLLATGEITWNLRLLDCAVWWWSLSFICSSDHSSLLLTL